MIKAPDTRTPDPEETSQLQLERLQSTLNRAAKNVPFHRNRLLSGRGAGEPPPAFVESLEDLALLPFMERKHLGEHYPYGLFAVPLRDIVRIHTAAGATVNPTVSGYTPQDLGIWREVVQRALAAAGVTPHDILQIALDWGLANWGRDYKDGAEALGASVIPNTPLSLEKQLLVLRDYKSSALITTPSAAAQLAKRIFALNLNPTTLNLRTLILVGEPPDRGFRDHLEDQLHVVTWLHYGLSEVPGPAVAFECRSHEGLHVNTEHFLPEIIDPATGRVLRKGETGELVLTTLTTRAFPLIRFRTGDQARLIPHPCPCGSPSIRIEWLPARTDEMLNIDGVKVHGRQIRHHIESVVGGAVEFHHFVKRRPDEKNSLEIWLTMEDNLFSDEIKVLERLVRDTQERLHENIGVRVAIHLRERSTLTQGGKGPPSGQTSPSPEAEGNV